MRLFIYVTLGSLIQEKISRDLIKTQLIFSGINDPNVSFDGEFFVKAVGKESTSRMEYDF